MAACLYSPERKRGLNADPGADRLIGGVETAGPGSILSNRQLKLNGLG